MAKKVKKSAGELPDPLKNFLAIDSESQIIAEADTETEQFIPTGSLILDAAISGRLGGWTDENGEKVNGGIPSNRVTLICGESQTGKSFLILNICREAQKLGYNVLYLDSEGAIDKQTIERLGCDPKRFVIRPISTVAEATNVILKMIQNLDEEEKTYSTHSPWIICLDSIANLSSVKEKNDLLNASSSDGYVTPKDLTRAQALKSLYRCVTSDLSRLQVPLICSSHTYASMNMYSSVKTQIAGGSGAEYAASVILELTRKKSDDKETEKRASQAVNSQDLNAAKTSFCCVVNCRKSRYTLGRKSNIIISMFKKMNPFYYLGAYLDWDRALVAPGKIITEKEYEKLSDADKAKVKTFEYEGETKYALLKDTIRSVVIGRKNMTVPFEEFLSEKVFDNEFLKFMDLEIIRPAFQLPSIQQLEEMEKKENEPEINAL